MRIRTLLGALALAGTALTACAGGDGGGGGTGPQAGNLNVTLSSAPSNVGAVLFTITGGPINGVSAAGYHTYETSLSNTSRRVLITGNITASLLVQISVPDVNQFASYSTSIQQVAARSTAPNPYAQMSSAGMAIAVTK